MKQETKKNDKKKERRREENYIEEGEQGEREKEK